MIKTTEEELLSLISLQEAENILKDKREKLDIVDEEIKKIEKKNEDIFTELKEKEREYEELKTGYEEIKETYEFNVARIKKSSEDIKSVQTNKEYQTLLREIDENKKKQSHFEDEMLIAMESMEKSQKIIEELRVDSEQLVEQIKADKKKIQNNSKKDKKEFKEITKKIEKICKGNINKNILKNFKKILSQKEGIAFAPVKNLTCYGCFMSIPPQICVELKKSTVIDFCPHCHRMIYHED